MAHDLPPSGSYGSMSHRHASDLKRERGFRLRFVEDLMVGRVSFAPRTKMARFRTSSHRATCQLESLIRSSSFAVALLFNSSHWSAVRR
jgi:hypothetical protein